MKLFDRLLERFPSLSNSNLDSTNYEVRAKPQAANHLVFLAKKILTQIVLSPLYLLLVLPLAALGTFYWMWRLNTEERRSVRLYCEKFWYYPSLCIHKAIEGRWFSTMTILPPSCEIGCEDGVVTSLHFPGAIFDLGIEYIAANAPQGAVHRTVRVAGLPDLPADLEGAFRTIALVHVIDHIPLLTESLRTLRRIARPGTRICLSGLAQGYPYDLRLASGGLLDEDWLQERKGLHHFLTPEQWRAEFTTAGFEVIRMETFLGGMRGLAWTALHSVFEINGSNDLWYAADRVGLLPREVRRYICVPFAMAVSSWFILDRSRQKNPCHFFAELGVPDDSSATAGASAPSSRT